MSIVRRLLALALLAPAVWAQMRAEVRENEVWLIRDGEAKQLTHDGRSKLQVLYSFAFDRLAYDEQCAEAEHCIPSVVILGPDGNRQQSFHPETSAVGGSAPCASIANISWVAADRAIGVECHESPSMNEYVEIDLADGKTLRDWLGFGFTPSSSGDHIAYVGPLIHFAPPYRKSNYLLIDGVRVYPLPKGARPQVQKPDEDPIDVVREVGSRFVGIHEFVPRFSWSPDSKKVAFIDCIYDWIEKGTDSGGGSIGDAVNNKCSIAVVALDGTVQSFPLPPDVPLYGLNAAEAARLAWKGSSVVLTWPVTRTFQVP